MLTYGSIIRVRKNNEVYVGEVIDFTYTINGTPVKPGDDLRKVTSRLTVVLKDDGTTESITHQQIVGVIRR